MSDEEQNQILGSTVEEFVAAKKKLAALHAKAEHLGIYLAKAGDALRERHSLWVIDYEMTPGHELDLKNWPTADELKRLVQEIRATQNEKSRLAGILEDAGYLGLK
jgi:hypothetical protein